MSDFVQTVRPWAELAYFFGGVVLAAAGTYGLQQIRLMKKDMKTRSERAAREKAIEYVSRYFEVFVPLDNAFFKDLQAKNLRSYGGPLGDFTYSSVPEKDRPDTLRRWDCDSWLPSLNALHTIAAAFAYGVADDDVGFQAIGRTYCSTVASRYDLLCFARFHVSCRHYEGIVQLFRMWSPRLSKTELLALRDRVDDRLTGLNREQRSRHDHA